MKKKRHKPEQVISMLSDAQASLASGKDLKAVCQLLGISTQTYYRWRSEYGDMTCTEARKLKELELQNKQLKQLLAEVTLDKAILTEALDFAKKV